MLVALGVWLDSAREVSASGVATRESSIPSASTKPFMKKNQFDWSNGSFDKERKRHDNEDT
tara:strand:+ start:320 stop:502 length:183 start_codon:yes stop_codon:yes gene_type:complete